MNTFQLDLGNLQIKLSDEKLFVNTFASNETFALRSINGLGVIDLLDAFNKKLTIWKIKRFIAIISVFIAARNLHIIVFDDSIFKNTNIAFFIFFLALGLYIIAKYRKPILMSAVRIMLNGGNRDFEFDKTGVDSEAVAEFVARVESTLTAYHKKD